MNTRRTLSVSGSARKLAVLALSLTLIILLFEASSGLFWKTLVPESGKKAFEEMYQMTASDYDIVPDPFLEAVSRDYLQEKGRFMEALAERDPTAIYIAALGGSTTAASWDGWPQVLETELNERLSGSPYHAIVFNFGVPSWSSQLSLLNYVYLLQYLPPDIVIIHHNANDRQMGFPPEQANVLDFPEIGPTRRTLVRVSKSVRWAAYLAHMTQFRMLTWNMGNPLAHDFSRDDLSSDEVVSLYIGQPTGILRNDAGYFWRDYARMDFNRSPPPTESTGQRFLHDTYQSLIDLTAAHNVTLVLTTQYLNYSKAQYATGKEWETEYAQHNNDMLRSLASENGVAFIDLDRNMTPFDYLMRDDGIHWTPEGVRVKAHLVEDALWGIMAERWNVSDSTRGAHTQ